ncbi:MAG: hypothetical protein P9L94_19800 [Candidatus Hinthialibacter antarcticus]|nr:hypothetical protein [Candidatus Hinthialibacter antarcticus]
MDESKQEIEMNILKINQCLIAIFIIISPIFSAQSQEKNWYDAYFIPGLVNARLNYETETKNYSIWREGIELKNPDVTEEQLSKWKAAQEDEGITRSIRIINADESYFSEDIIVTSKELKQSPTSHPVLYSRLIIDKDKSEKTYQIIIPGLVENSNPINSVTGQIYFKMRKSLAIRTACLQRMDFFVPVNAVLNSRQNGNITQLYEGNYNLVFIEYETDVATGLLSRVVFYKDPNETRSEVDRRDVPINEIAAYIDSMTVYEYLYSDYIRHEPSGIPLPKHIEKKRYYRTRIENRSPVKLIDDTVDTLISFYARDAEPGTMGRPPDGKPPRPSPGMMPEPITETPMDIPAAFVIPTPSN